MASRPWYNALMPRHSRRIPRNVLVVAIVAFFSGLTQEMVTPVLPIFFTALGYGAAGIGLIDGLVTASANFFKIIAGYFSDRYRNRKGFVFLGYAFSAVARPLLAFVSGFGGAAGLRALDGIGKGIKDGPRDALIADATPKGSSGRVFGFHRVIDTMGSVAGPLIAAALLAGSIGLESQRNIFALTAIPGVIALGLILFGIREPASNHSTGRVKVGKLPRLFWIFTLIAFLAAGTRTADGLLLLRSRGLGVPIVAVPLLYAFFHLVYASLSYPFGVWSDRIGKLPMLVMGSCLLALVQAGFAVASGPLAPIVLFALYGVFFALTEGTNRAWISELVPANARATAYGVWNGAVGAAAVLSGIIIGGMWELWSPQIAFSFSAFGALLAAGLYGGLMRRIRIKTRAAQA